MLALGAVIAALAGAPRCRRRARRCCSACVALDVVVALVTARAGPRAWAALALAPAYVVWKVVLQVRAVGAARIADRPFEPTVRD